MADVTLRPARPDEREALEALQMQASLANEGDRQTILDHPDAINLPLDQIAAGLVIVAEAKGALLGFAALLPRADGEVDLDGLFVDPGLWRRGVGGALVARCADMARLRGPASFMCWATPMPWAFTRDAASSLSGSRRPGSAPA